VNNTVTCIYGGYAQAWPYGGTITSTVPLTINCEHSLPQSFFRAEEPMRSDLHHLYPTHVDLNSARGSYDFGDNDEVAGDTARWYLGTSFTTTAPPAMADSASELGDEPWTAHDGPFWEPPEAYKGNIARSMMYMYTMYETQLANLATIISQTSVAGKPAGYPGMGVIDDVLNEALAMFWHTQDPPNADELARDDAISKFQGNHNPFVTNPKLARRAFPYRRRSV